MKFRKLFILSIALMFLMTGVAFATGGADGDLNLNAQVIDDDPGFTGKIGPGITFGGAFGWGKSHLDAEVGAWFGEAGAGNEEDGTAFAGAGAGAESDSYKTKNQQGEEDKFQGVGTNSSSGAHASAGSEFYAFGIAGVDIELCGWAVQGSGGFSAIGAHPQFTTAGGTYAGAYQGSIGGFTGDAKAGLFGWGEIGADVAMNGMTSVYSERYLTNGGKTEGFYSSASAETTVQSNAIEEDCGLAVANVNGGWVAGGGINIGAVQTAPGAYGSANVSGSYSSAGSLGRDYEGSVNGHVQTQITQDAGYTSVYTSGHVNVTSY